MSFIDEYCTGFDDEDEHKLEFTKIHNVSPPAEMISIKHTIVSKPCCFLFSRECRTSKR